MNTIIKNATFKVITLDILKAHLRLENSIEDDYLDKIIDMATNVFENRIGKSVLKRKYSYIFEHNKNFAKKVILPIYPVTKICRVQKLINNNKQKINFTEQSENNTKYITVFRSEHPIEIQYYAGLFGTYDEIPKDIQYAVLQIARDIYECNDENLTNTEFIKQIINSYKEIRIS